MQDENLAARCAFAVQFLSLIQCVRRVEIESMVEETKKALGSSFTVQHQTESLRILAETKIDSFDAEGDPANLCQLPRTHKKMAIISLVLQRL